MKRDKKFLTGFTLVEMLVSLALFSVVMILSASSLFFVMEGSRKARSTSSVIGNLNYALENMSRNIKKGSSFHCGDSRPFDEPKNCWRLGKNAIVFEPKRGNDRWVFKEGSGVLKRSTDGGSNFIEMTSDNVVIEEMKFYVKGAIEGDNKQPKVVIIIRGYVESSKGIKSEFNIQTMVSQRVLDF